MSIDFAEYNFRVKVIAPGVTHNDQWPAVDDPKIQRRIRMIHSHRFGTTLDLSTFATFLVPAEASYISGQVISVEC